MGVQTRSCANRMVGFDMTFAARLAAAVAVICLACVARPALATDELRGVVLSVLSAQHEVVVRHDPYGGMPAMTMVFVLAAGDAARVHAGDRIDAFADRSVDPARLERVQVVGKLSDVAHAIRDVQPLVVGDTMPQTQFFDQLGRGFSFTDFRGKSVLLSFIYTRCIDARMCPLISTNFRALQTKLSDLPVQLVEITPIRLRHFLTFCVLTAGSGAIPRVGRRAGPEGRHRLAARFGIAVFADSLAACAH